MPTNKKNINYDEPRVFCSFGDNLYMILLVFCCTALRICKNSRKSTSFPSNGYIKFFGHPGCSAFSYTIPFGTLDASLRPGGGVWGRWAPKLVGRHRDLNPGPPACESGVLAITLRGPPRYIKFKNIFLVTSPSSSTSFSPLSANPDLPNMASK